MTQIKFIFSFLMVFVSLISCKSNSNQTTNKKSEIKSQNYGLIIYAFHGTRQCTTCKNMKAFTKSTLDKFFPSELKSGKIEYKIIDVDEEKNYEMAEKFEATGTALMINNIKNGKEKIENWSEFAFEYANGDQKTFEAKLKGMIEAKLN